MNDYSKEILAKLEQEINELTIEEGNCISLCETVIELMLITIADIKELVIKKGFSSDEEEIYFFKHIKPQYFSKLIYHNYIYKIETKKPFGGHKIIKKYLNNELNKIKRYFDNNLEFYKYYRTNSTYLDHKFFLRGKHDIKLSLDTFYFEADHCFATSHDYKVSKIIAYDLIQLYLEDQIYKTTRQNTSNLNWMGSKTALTELIYALHSQGAFGNADIIAIAKTFENTFNISLGDFYHTFMELKSRKINRTKFIDSLREALVRKMDEEDERIN